MEWERRVDKRGFTLLEVMIAVAVIAIALVTLFGSQSQSISFSAEAEFDAQAALLAGERLAELHLQDFDDIQDDSGDFGEEFASYVWESKVSLLDSGEVGIDQAEEMLKVVEVSVSRKHENSRSFIVRTILFRAMQTSEDE